METILEDASDLSQRVRSRLFGIAYRMLGSIEDAEDLVQETFLRWHRADDGNIREPEAWMVTVVTRLAIDRLRRARVERATYAGPWLPEPLPSADSNRHRARARVRRDRPRFAVSPQVTAQLLERFHSALRTEDKVAMLGVLDDTYASDGGGRVRTARRVVRGAGRVGRMLIGLQQKFWRHGLTHRLSWLHGEPAVVSLDAEGVRATTFIGTDGARITAFYRVANPEKLRRVQPPAWTARG